MGWKGTHTVTKSDLTEAIHQRVGVSRERCAEIVELILGTMAESLERGESVKISSFGAFDVRTKEPRRGRNPQTGEAIVLSERRVVTFRASPVVKERLNRKG